MDPAHARRILSTYRLGEAAPPGSELAEALAAAQSDPQLAAWLEDQLRVDRSLRARMRSMPAPPGLRDAILAGRPARPGPWLRSGPAFWAMAASLAVLAGLGAWIFSGRPSRGDASLAIRGSTDAGAFRDAMASMLTEGRYALQIHSPSLPELRRFLSGKSSAAAAPMPPGLEPLESYGCQVLSWEGRKVTLICFSSPSLGIVHLVLTDGALPGRTAGALELAASSGWNTALWEREGRTYLLLARGSDGDLRTLAGG
ncbi:MAG: hypothetical protein J0L84_09510 [Verrucomicrobia bacterium]|nr:hypothetical protein [Verrucomicrobiota bacterium]